MLILFDNGTPRGLARFLTGHAVEEAREHGWEELANGALIEAAEQAGFEVIVVCDGEDPDTRTLSQSYRAEYPLSWIFTSERHGLPSARNTARFPSHTLRPA